MLRLSNLAKLATSAKAALTPRDAASVRQNVETIDAAVQKLTATVRAYAGGLLAASSITGDEAALGQDIKHATADARASEPVDAAEARHVIAYIRDTLEPHIAACMAAVVDKKAHFVAASLASTVAADMADLRKLTTHLAEALVAKTPPAERDAGLEVMQKIDAAFALAIESFA